MNRREFLQLTSTGLLVAFSTDAFDGGALEPLIVSPKARIWVKKSKMLGLALLDVSNSEK